MLYVLKVHFTFHKLRRSRLASRFPIGTYSFLCNLIILRRRFVVDKDSKLWISQYNDISPQYSLTSDIILKKTNLNTYYMQCSSTLQQIDELVIKSHAETIKLIIFYQNTTNCKLRFYSHMASISTRIQSLRIPTYCILEGYIAIDDYLPMLFCTKRLLYENARIVFYLKYFQTDSIILSDTIKNTLTYTNIIKRVILKN